MEYDPDLVQYQDDEAFAQIIKQMKNDDNKTIVAKIMKSVTKNTSIPADINKAYVIFVFNLIKANQRLEDSPNMGSASSFIYNKYIGQKIDCSNSTEFLNNGMLIMIYSE